MAKYGKKLVDEIVLLIEEDNYTISDVCKVVGVSRTMFYKWQNTKPEFAEAIDKAMERRDEELKHVARQSLRKKLEGYTKVETTIKYVPDAETGELVVKEYVVREKYVAPDTSVLMYALDGKARRQSVSCQPVQQRQLNFRVGCEEDRKNIERLREKLRSDVRRIKHPESRFGT